MISIIITAFKDPQSTKESIKCILNQKNLSEKYELIVACPDEPTKKVILEYKKKYPKLIRYVYQDDNNKNALMNKIMKITKGRILIWTDGNKFMDKEAVSILVQAFNDPSVGIAGGRPIAMNKRNTLFGYWAHMLTSASNQFKQRRFKRGGMVEHSANILSFRSGIIKEIPLDVAEDAIISHMVASAGYKNLYLPSAKVLVTYPTNFQEWVKQKVRSIKSHEALNKYIDHKKVKMKSFKNEFFYGILFSFSFPKSLKELYWTLLLYPARLYIWLKSFYEIKFKQETYSGHWSRSESTKVFDYKK